MIGGGADVIRIERKCTINVKCLSHHTPTHPFLIHGKLSSMKPFPGTKKLGAVALKYKSQNVVMRIKWDIYG